MRLLLTSDPDEGGFMPKRSTIDWNIGLRVVIDRHLEHRWVLLAANLDFKKAFDSVDKRTLWDLLRRCGIPTGIFSLISALYTNTERVIKSGGDVSCFFPVKS